MSRFKSFLASAKTKRAARLALTALFLSAPMLAFGAETPPGLEDSGVTIYDDSAMMGGFLGLMLGLATGTLGKAISVLALLWGIVAGAIQGSLKGLLIGFGVGASLWFGPGMLLAFFSATI